MAALKLIYKNKLIIVIFMAVIISILYYYLNATPNSGPNYIICFPRGGLIYMIHRIIEAHKYAVKYDRILIVDTRKNWFKDSLYEYFFIHSHNVYVGDIDFLYSSLQPLTMYPNYISLKNMNVCLATENSGSLRNYNINLKTSYNERVLIYSHYGGGSSIKEFFSICSLTPLVFSAYKSAREKLPASYLSVHIRNTDYKSDIATFLKKHTELLTGKPVFLATDDKKTIDLFKKKFNVYSFSDIPYNNEKSLHEDYIRTGSEIRKYNIDTIVDLLLLASGSELYYSYAESAFTQAAIELHEDPILLKRLTTQPINIT